MLRFYVCHFRFYLELQHFFKYTVRLISWSSHSSVGFIHRLHLRLAWDHTKCKWTPWCWPHLEQKSKDFLYLWLKCILVICSADHAHWIIQRLVHFGWMIKLGKPWNGWIWCWKLLEIHKSDRWTYDDMDVKWFDYLGTLVRHNLIAELQP